MNARAREELRLLMWWRLCRDAGLPGERFSASELAKALGVPQETIVSWIERGWLRASKLRVSQGKGWYRIRRRAVRRAICDHPKVALAVMRAGAKVAA
jgi:excisionase family DNA binding protein